MYKKEKTPAVDLDFELMRAAQRCYVVKTFQSIVKRSLFCIFVKYFWNKGFGPVMLLNLAFTIDLRVEYLCLLRLA